MGADISEVNVEKEKELLAEEIKVALIPLAWYVCRFLTDSSFH
jgi:hypothetical protein